MKSDSIFKSLDAIATEGISRKKRTLFAKKVTIDLDEQHLIILDKRLKMAGYHGCMRGVIWEALELLADKYYEGAYIVKDVKAAIYWYEKAANQGSVYAMYQAGYVYYTVPIDYNKAGQWFSLAAEKGNKDAEDVLRNHLRYNRFTKKWDAVR